jgi:DNA repair protein RadC
MYAKNDSGITRYRYSGYLLFIPHLIMENGSNKLLNVCEVKMSYQPKVKPSERPVIGNSMDIYRILMDYRVFDPETIEYKEYFKVLLLNTGNKLLGVLHISEGSIKETTVDLHHIMQGAILANSRKMILCHNHPSGNCAPGRADDLVTRKIKTACELFDIQIIDHVIVSPCSYYSYADESHII